VIWAHDLSSGDLLFRWFAYGVGEVDTSSNLSPNDLNAFWVPFTAKRQFKKTREYLLVRTMGDAVAFGLPPIIEK